MKDRCQFQRDGDCLVCERCGRRLRTHHAAVPTVCRLQSPKPDHRPVAIGPGTALKKLLAGWPFFIETTKECPCEYHALQMDAWGPAECDRQMGTIVEWLREEAERRELFFTYAAGRLLVRRAIALARRSVHVKSDHQ